MDYTTSKFLQKKEKKTPPFFRRFFTKFLLCIIILLVTMIFLKNNPKLKDQVYHYIFDNNFSFSKIHEFYDQHFGGILPFDNVLGNDTVSVFNEKISYKNATSVDNGVKLNVDKNYLIPVIESGIVVYMGEKDKYGYTVIIQQVDGVNAWYGSVNCHLKMYDYVEKGSLLGESLSDNIYLFFQKEGKFIDYKKYI